MNKKINVLHLFGTYLPQTENWSYRLIKYTPNTNVFVGTQRYLESSFYDSDFTFIKNKSCLDRTKLFNRDRNSILNHLNYYFLKLKMSFNKGDAKELLNECELHSIDVVHAHFANVAWFYKELMEQKDRPFVVSFYGWDYEQLAFLHPEYEERLKIIFAKAKAIICEGDHGKKVIVAKGCPGSKVHVINLGVEVDRIPFFNRTKIRNSLKLVQIATFTEKKGHVYTIQAFHQALQNAPNIHLTIVGGGKVKIINEIKDYVLKHELSRNVTILEAIDFKKLYQFLENFDVFIHPSCYASDRDCEGGAPIVLLDAQATGMPVLSTFHCDIPQEVINNKTGFLVKEKDVKSLSEKIIDFYKMDNSSYSNFSKNCRKHVAENYDVKKTFLGLYEIYGRIIRK